MLVLDRIETNSDGIEKIIKQIRNVAANGGVYNFHLVTPKRELHIDRTVIKFHGDMISIKADALNARLYGTTLIVITPTHRSVNSFYSGGNIISLINCIEGTILLQREINNQHDVKYDSNYVYIWDSRRPNQHSCQHAYNFDGDLILTIDLLDFRIIDSNHIWYKSDDTIILADWSCKIISTYTTKSLRQYILFDPMTIYRHIQGYDYEVWHFTHN